MQQAIDFKNESAALAALLSPLSDQDFQQQTLFKKWTLNNILRHLHVWNIAADLSLESDDKFDAFVKGLFKGAKGVSFTQAEADYLDNLSGRALFDAWQQQYTETANRFADTDPKRRLKWVGPDMSAISSITARLMETWAHGQAVYDVMGVVRHDDDRIGNIVRLGVNTYGWTFKNRKEDIPQPMPYVCLTAPSGGIWEYGEQSDSNFVKGSASEFCQVVTQCRNIADTSLSVHGDAATRWMNIAQCFAGAPNDPPAAGFRKMAYLVQG